jgi:sigma-B regulation protein RsbU (phosphoserine phosphatase)
MPEVNMNAEHHVQPVVAAPRIQHAIRDAALQGQLVERRERLKDALSRSSNTERLVHLLQEVDGALERMDHGSYGLCESCHEPIEHDRLLVNPLIRYCLDHLSDAEQRALERDLDLAARIQGGLLPPKDLQVDGWQVAYHYEPAGPVSGDYCDLIHDKTSGGFYFMIGDVTGKGVAASILMAHLHAIFRSLVTSTHHVHELVERANRIFCEGTLSTHFATLVCGKATSDGNVEICNAGHCLPLLSARGAVTTAPPTGLPLGLFRDEQYTATRFALRPGDNLFLYTDGITEARNGVSAFYGEERLTTVFGTHADHAPKNLIPALLHDLTSFRSGTSLMDDVSMMAIRRG